MELNQYIEGEQKPLKKWKVIADNIERTCRQVRKAIPPNMLQERNDREERLLEVVYRFSFHNEVDPKLIYRIITSRKMPSYDFNGQTKLIFN